MPLARELFRKLKTLNPKLTIAEANRLALDWCKNVNGMQIHGTTGEKPFEAFESREKPALKPLPDTPFEMATWKKVKVHPDQFIQFEKKTFSVASRFVGRTLWARGTEKLIQIYDLDYRLVKQHVRTGAFRHTDWSDFPDNVTLMLSDRAVVNVIRRAAAIGPSMEAYVRRILEPHAKINLRKALGIVGLRGHYTTEQLEAAAMVANSGRFVSYKAFKRLLDEEPVQKEEPIPISNETASFMRSADYFIHNN